MSEKNIEIRNLTYNSSKYIIFIFYNKTTKLKNSKYHITRKVISAKIRNINV